MQQGWALRFSLPEYKPKSIQVCHCTSRDASELTAHQSTTTKYELSRYLPESGFSSRPRRGVLSLVASKFSTPGFRRQAIKHRRMRQREHRKDKCFTAAAAASTPHMEWISGNFKECAPKPLPSLIVKAEIMEESLKALGGKPTTNQKNNKLTVYADSCCQTCTAGPD